MIQINACFGCVNTAVSLVDRFRGSVTTANLCYPEIAVKQRNWIMGGKDMESKPAEWSVDIDKIRRVLYDNTAAESFSALGYVSPQDFEQVELASVAYSTVLTCISGVRS
jgi:hypothetical protein